MLVSVMRPILPAALVGAASWVSRRWGAFVGGLFVALPLTSGPVVYVLTIDRGREFAIATVSGMLLAPVAHTLFAVSYERGSRVLPWTLSVCSASATYLLASAALRYVQAPLLLDAAVGLIAPVVALRFLPGDRSPGPSRPSGTWDIPLRMLVAAGMVVTITMWAPILGPRFSGLLTPFPVTTTVLAASIHRADGPKPISGLLRGVMLGFFSFSSFFIILGVTLRTWSIPAAFGAAAAGAVLLQGCVLVGTRRRPTPA